jgi:putative ABC transport system permease protein
MALTLLGITIGVSVFFAMRTANSALLGSLRDTAIKLGGRADLEVTAGEAGFPEAVLDTVRSTPGVHLAEPTIEVVAHTALDDAANIMIVGVDTTGDQALREYDFDASQVHVGNPLAFVLSPDSIAISTALADRYGLKEGDKLPVFTSAGKQDLTVRGTFKATGIGEIFGGQIAVMDIHSMQFIFDRGGNFDRIDLVTDRAVDVEAVRSRLMSILPSGFDVSKPAARGKNLENALSAMSQGFLLTSLIALLVGMFIIFNSFSIAIHQRWKEIGILRALGTERRNILRMFLVEAALIGAIGSLLGIAGGFLLAGAANQIMNNIASSTYGILSSPIRPAFNFRFALEAAILGVGASIIAAALPSRAASQLDPALALHNVEARQGDAALRPAKLPVGAAITGSGLLLVAFTSPRVGALIQFSYAVLILIGFVVMLPTLAAWIGRILRPVMDGLFGSEGALAVDSMIQAPLRTSATVGALMMGLSFVLSTQAFIRSQKQVFARSMDNELTADIYIATSNLARSRTFHFSEDLGARVAEVPGVRRLENLRFTFVPYGGDNVALIAFEMEAWFERVHDILEEGDERLARERGPKGDGFLISRNFSTRWGVRTGDDLRLESPAGPLVRPVLGVLEDYSSEKGTVFVDRALYKTYWRDNAVDFFDVSIAPNADQAAVKNDIERAISGNYHAFVYTNGEYKRWIMTIIDRFFALNYAQMAIAIFIGALGTINTLIISVAERKREIGVIRAIGALRGQVRRLVVLEAVSIAIVGLAVGVLKSMCDTYFLVRTAAVIFGGYTVPYNFPATTIMLTIPVVGVLALLSAWWPARRAAGLNVADAIGYE